MSRKASFRLPVVVAIVLVLIPLAGALPIGSARAVAPDCGALSEPLFERVGPKSGSTLLTPWIHQADNAVKKDGYSINRGVVASIAVEPTVGLVAVKWLHNPRTHDFLYTQNDSRVKAAVSRGYQNMGNAFYAASSSTTCARPIYRYAKLGVSRYAFTPTDRATLAKTGYILAEVAFYAVLPSHTPPVSAPTSPAKAVNWERTKGRGPLDNPPFYYTGTDAWNAYETATTRREKRLFYQIAVTPMAIWLGGGTSNRKSIDGVEKRAVAARETPYFVLYAIPNRDCGGYSAGGLSNSRSYDHWINSVRAGIKNRPTVALVEPDAIGMGCLSNKAKLERKAMLRYAMHTLSKDPNTFVYIHAGSAGGNPKSVASILDETGIRSARGFVINIAGYDATSREEAYGDSVLAELHRRGIAGKHYIIDTGRNGLGRQAPGENGTAGSCNPPGRAVGQRPTNRTGNPNVDAWVWVKAAGGSDGQCHPGDPKHWWPERALEMTQRALDHKIISDIPLPG